MSKDGHRERKKKTPEVKILGTIAWRKCNIFNHEKYLKKMEFRLKPEVAKPKTRIAWSLRDSKVLIYMYLETKV